MENKQTKENNKETEEQTKKVPPKYDGYADLDEDFGSGEYDTDDGINYH